MMAKFVNLLSRMYLRTLPGRIALFALLLLLCIPLVHFFGGAPSTSDLRLVEGVVIDLRMRQTIKGGTEVRLNVGVNNNFEELAYLSNPGDTALDRLVALRGKVVRAWVKSTHVSSIYQLDAEGKRIVDYEVRNRELIGNPQTLLIYFVAALGTFVLLSAKRYSEESASL